ncbi:MAG: PorP/SprF family type IX secretion system membrane protein [Bacteroidota bacterium]
MNKTSTLILSVLFCLLMFRANGQDKQFSQFYTAPLYLNPALTGVFEGSFRISLNYREQYNSILSSFPSRTVHASFDKKHRVGKNDYFSYGVNVLQDQAGESLFAQYRGNLSASYMKQLSGSKYSSQSQYLVAGAQLGIGQNKLDPGRLWFSAQWDEPTISVNQGANNLEPNLNNASNVFLDFNAGLLWYTRIDENTSFYIGGALNHISPVEISLYEGESETLYTRWVGHAGAELPLSRELSVLPAVLVMGQGPSFQTNLGANFRYSNNDWRELAIRAGLWGRLSRALDSSHIDAVIVSTILEMERFQLGLSYDINASSLRDASQNRGAFEVSLMYTHPAKERFKLNCPKF